jgi:hypothetical protein
MGIEEHFGDYGVALAVIAGAVLIIRALTALATTWITAWQSTRQKELAVDQRRNDIEEQQVKTLERMSIRLEQLELHARQEAGQTRDLVLAARRETQQATGATLELLGEVKDAIAEVPTLTAEEVRARVEPLFAKAQESITHAATSLLSANTQIEQVATLLRTQTTRHETAQEGHEQPEKTEPTARQLAGEDNNGTET